MRVLYVYNKHRGGGGASNATAITIELSRQYGLDVAVFTRNSNEMRSGAWGRTVDAAGAFYQREWQFQSILDKFKPDVVHVSDLFPMISPWILRHCTNRGIPVVMTCYDYRLTCPITTHYRHGLICTKCIGGKEYWPVLLNCRQNMADSIALALYRAMIRKFRLFTDHVSRFLAPSEFTRQWLIEKAGIAPARVTTIELVIKLANTPVDDPASGSYVAFAGRFTPEKGIDILLEAARIAGVPVRLSRNEKFLVKYDVPEGVDVVVTSTQSELDAFYRGARIAAVPSIWFESFGLVAGEAMSHGIPVVVSRLGALGCLVEDGVDGVYFEPGDARDLADKITRIWKDPQLCRRLGAAGRKRVADRWNPRDHFNRHVAVYEDVCRERIARRG